MRSIRKKLLRRRSQRGQSMLEMALMMVVLLTILSGVLDLGRGFFSFIAIQNAAGEGALYAAINPRCPHASSPSDCTDPNNVDYRAKHESESATERRLIDPARMIVSVTYSDGTNQYSGATIEEGQPVTVTVLYKFPMVGPFSGVFPNGELTFMAHSTQNILDLKKNGSLEP